MKQNDFRVLVITNRPDPNINLVEAFEVIQAYEIDSLNINIDFATASTDIGLYFKKFGVHILSRGVKKDVWGLDGVKDQLRKSGINFNLYHAVFFVYDDKQTMWATDPSFKGEVLGNWTRWGELQPGCEFIEMHPNSTKQMVQIFTHEIRHAYKNKVRRQNIAIRDAMDMTPVPHDCNTKKPKPGGQCIVDIPYYKENDMYAPDGNRAIANSILQPHVDLICAAPVTLLIMLAKLKLKVLQLMLLLKEKKKNTVLNNWAEAIKFYEGWFVGSRSYRNFSPGNLRWSKYQTGSDGGYAVFKDYETGRKALIFQLEIAATGRSSEYWSGMDLYQFFDVYAPSTDGNHPRKYAEYVAHALGVPVDTPIYQLIED